MDVPLHSENFEHQARYRLGILSALRRPQAWPYASAAETSITRTSSSSMHSRAIAYLDDSQINELHLFRAYDPANPRIEVEIATL